MYECMHVYMYVCMYADIGPWGPFMFLKKLLFAASIDI